MLELEGTSGDHPVHPLILVCSYCGKTRAALFLRGGSAKGKLGFCPVKGEECPSISVAGKK